MFVARKGALLVLLLGLTVALVAASPLAFHQAGANDTIDTIITGSLAPEVEGATPTPDPKGSAAFRAALAVLVKGDHAAAYALARKLPDDTERRTIQWAAIYYGEGTIDYGSVIRFSADAPAFSDTSVFKTRLEQALVR
ncbi:MAG TPA: hypothetical protein GYA10_05465, partial [Alphaproteobacteria bacterium]|nr:hypothetical protein [Alphaproteobacteria bacterium]